ncbi:SapC family protein [Sphingomonas sp. CJ20]
MADQRPVTFDLYAQVRIDRRRMPALGDAVQLCLVVPDEFRQLQNAYPILFQRDASRTAFQAVALFGFAPGENLYLDGAGWDAPCLPLAMATRPFLAGPPAVEGGVPQLYIDQDSPRMRYPGDADYAQGAALFDAAGQASPYLDAVLEGLGRLDAGYRAAAGFFEALDRHDLIEPVSIGFEQVDGTVRQIVDFHGIHEERFAALDGEALGELHAAGHLLPATMAMASLANLAPLIARKNRSLVDG